MRKHTAGRRHYHKPTTKIKGYTVKVMVGSGAEGTISHYKNFEGIKQFFPVEEVDLSLSRQQKKVLSIRRQRVERLLRTWDAQEKAEARAIAWGESQPWKDFIIIPEKVTSSKLSRKFYPWKRAGYTKYLRGATR